MHGKFGFGSGNPLYRGGDPERFRDEAKGLGRIALLGHFTNSQPSSCFRPTSTASTLWNTETAHI
jgi:hypothetical protein